MALVVLLRGVNVGGHKTFRPSRLAEDMKHLDVVNIGAAGTFVIRKPVSSTRLRAEFTRRLPFDAEIVICQGREIVGLLSRDFFSDHPVRRDIVRFVSVLARNPRTAPPTPMSLPPTGGWLVRVLVREGRFLVGVYRRRMKVLGYLGSLERIYGVPGTMRSWNTVTAIAKVVGSPAAD